jgi:hypothetical protein
VKQILSGYEFKASQWCLNQHFIRILSHLLLIYVLTVVHLTPDGDTWFIVCTQDIPHPVSMGCSVCAFKKEK